MSMWDEEPPTPGAKCESLPLDEAVELFLPTSEGGLMRRTRPWPQSDSHEDARRICGHCPALSACLQGALVRDGWTFRGGMSPEERAAFGGFRDRDARKRPVYLTRAQVVARLVDSGMDTDAISQVLHQWRDALTEDAALREAIGAVDVGGVWWTEEALSDGEEGDHGQVA